MIIRYSNDWFIFDHSKQALCMLKKRAIITIYRLKLFLVFIVSKTAQQTMKKNSFCAGYSIARNCFFILFIYFLMSVLITYCWSMVRDWPCRWVFSMIFVFCWLLSSFLSCLYLDVSLSAHHSVYAPIIHDQIPFKTL